MKCVKWLKRKLPPRHPLRLGWHAFRAFAAALRYGLPARKLNVVAVTGTDGKTTTVGMIAHILNHAGDKAGLPAEARCAKAGAASTTFFQMGTEREINETHKTSIDPFVLQKFLHLLVQKGCTHAVLEVSSHGLVQHRADFTWPAVAAVTNTTPEHLDYHSDMETYRRDKGKLFAMLKGRGVKVLNRDDDSFDLYSKIPSKQTMTYGSSPRHAEEPSTTLRQAQGDMLGISKHFWLSDIQASATTTSATLHSNMQHATCNVQLSFPGTFNVENALCAIACTAALGIHIETAVHALRTFQAIPGRLEAIVEGQPFLVFVDFAVSAASYEKTLQALRSMIEPGHRVLVLCGCCGNRMREKRTEVGRICSSLADVVVVAGDETYGEDPRKVLEEVWAGVDHSRCGSHKILDRREAIRFLLDHAKPGDAVAICGMGPFQTMMTLEGEIPWDEREVVRTILKEMRQGRGESSKGGMQGWKEVSPRGRNDQKKPSPREAKVSS